MRYILAWAGNTENGVPGEQEHLQYVSIVSNNVYAKFSAAMTKIMEAMWKAQLGTARSNWMQAIWTINF